MSFLKKIASIGSAILPIAIPGAGGAVAGLASGIVASGEAKKEYKKQQQAQAKESENLYISYLNNYDPVTGLTTSSNANQGFGAGFGKFLGEASQNILAPVGTFLGGLSSILGGGRPTSSKQQPAITTVTNVGAQESQGSGAIQAGFGSLIPSIIGAGKNLIKTPIGQTGIGTAVGVGLSMIGADGKPMRVTRKMKSQLKSLLNQTGNNYALVGDFLNLNTEQMLFILNKRFRNDGPVVTKAALRKTKSTIRKLKNMCDMYDDLRPSARRRSPIRRARTSTTLIKN